MVIYFVIYQVVLIINIIASLLGILGLGATYLFDRWKARRKFFLVMLVSAILNILILHVIFLTVALQLPSLPPSVIRMD